MSDLSKRVEALLDKYRRDKGGHYDSTLLRAQDGADLAKALRVLLAHREEERKCDRCGKVIIGDLAWYEHREVMCPLRYSAPRVEAKAEAGQVHEEPKNIEWVCAQIADCVWGCSWPPLDLTEEEISRIRKGAQYLMTSLRPAPAYALREDFLAFCEVVLKWLDAPMGFRAVSLEDIHAMTRKHISALRQSAKEGA